MLSSTFFSKQNKNKQTKQNEDLGHEAFSSKICLRSNDGMMFKWNSFFNHQSKDRNPTAGLSASHIYLPAVELGTHQ